MEKTYDRYRGTTGISVPKATFQLIGGRRK